MSDSSNDTMPLQEWLRIRDTKFVPLVRAEEDLRRNISDGTPFGQSLQEAVLRDLLQRVARLEAALGVV